VVSEHSGHLWRRFLAQSGKNEFIRPPVDIFDGFQHGQFDCLVRCPRCNQPRSLSPKIKDKSVPDDNNNKISTEWNLQFVSAVEAAVFLEADDGAILAVGIQPEVDFINRIRRPQTRQHVAVNLSASILQLFSTGLTLLAVGFQINALGSG